MQDERLFNSNESVEYVRLPNLCLSEWKINNEILDPKIVRISKDTHESWKKDYQIGEAPEIKVEYFSKLFQKNDSSILFSNNIHENTLPKLKGVVLIN